MSNVGYTLFRRSRFVRWALSPFILLFALLMPLLIERWGIRALAVLAAMEAMCITLLAGFWLPRKLGLLAFRCLSGLVFIAYAGILIDVAFLSPSHPAISPLSALLGFVIIGLPCLWYSLFGRFTFRPPENDDA